ncbi:MAG: 50S ribosomal protein L25 [Spirochaetaceae bacterium]|nr:50S ribosomal protein L25 [Spirochaetaceae bacterium]
MERISGKDKRIPAGFRLTENRKEYAEAPVAFPLPIDGKTERSISAMDQKVVTARVRTVTGKTAAKNLRKAGRLPAVIYDYKGRSVMLDIDEAEFTKVWKIATPTTLVTVDIDGKDRKLAFIKDTQNNLLQDRNLHIDFYAIEENKPLRKTIKIQVQGNPVGIRDGGIFEKGVQSVEIECLPKDLPMRMVVDVSDLGLSQTILVKDLPFAKEVKVLSDGDLMVAVMKNPKG